MSLSPETATADDVVVLDSPSPPRVDHPNRQPSQDVILLDNSPTPPHQTHQNEPILVDERPRKRRRRDTSAPQSTPIARPESGPSTTAPVIVVDDDDNIQPNNFQPPSNQDIIQPNHSTSPPPIVLSHPNINLSQSNNNNNNNIMSSTSTTTNNDHRIHNRRFFSMRDPNLTVPQNNIDADVVEMAAVGPRVLSAPASASTPSAPSINSPHPRASSSTINMRFPLTSNPTNSSNLANNQGSQDNPTPSGFATLLAAANAADQSNSHNRNSTQQNTTPTRNASSMPSLLSFREDQNHRPLHVFRSRAFRRTRGVIDAQANNRNDRTGFNLHGPSIRSATSGPSASDPFVGPASGTTPSPSIEIPTNESGGNNADLPTSGNYRSSAHVQNQRHGSSALFVALPQGSASQRSNQNSNSIPILNLNTGEVLQHGNNTSNGQQTSGSGTNPYSALHFIVAPPSLNIAVAPPDMNSSLPSAGTSSIGSIDTGDSQSTTQAQIRRRSGRRRQGPSMFLTMRSSQSRRAGGSQSQTRGMMSDTQGSGSNGQGSSTVRNPIGAYTAAILGFDPNLGRGSNDSRQRSNVRQRSHHLIQLMNTSGFGPPFEIQYIHGLAGDQELDYEQLIRLDEELVREKNRADKEQINALPTANATSEDKDIRCCICMCDVEEGEELRVLPCNHKYHKSCIDEWLTYNGCCPVDKKRIAPRTRRRGCSHHS